MSIIEVPGDLLEGGGQILRMSIALSAVTCKPIKVFNIRAKRSEPGLKAQHLTAIKSVAQIVDGEVRGLRLGSMEIEFYPKGPRGGQYFFDIGTAGSTTLVLQSLMPAASFAPSLISTEVKGGTNNPMAPPIDYVQQVLLPVASRMGYRGKVTLLRRGFYPKGGGIVRLVAEPIKHLNPLNLMDVGKVLRISGISYSSRLSPHITERMARSAKDLLKEAGYEDMDIEIECLQPGHGKCAINPGCGIILHAETSTGAILGSDSLGEIGKPAEVVGREAAQSLARQLEAKAAVDKHLGDQLIVYMALAKGSSTITVSELTMHTLTCIELSKMITEARFEVKGGLGGKAFIKCVGVGLKNPSIA